MENKNSEKVNDIKVYICNVISNFRAAKSFDLKKLARIGNNVYYNECSRTARMESSRPKFYATFWRTGKVLCAGAEDLDQAYYNARYICKLLRNLGFEIKMKSYRVINVMATVKMHHKVNLPAFSSIDYAKVEYNGDMHPGATLTMSEFKAVFKVFASGKATIMTTSMDNTYKAMDRFVELMQRFQREQEMLK